MNKTALPIVIAAFAAFAWLFRYDITPPGDKPVVWILDRWTGEARVVWGAESAAVRPQQGE